MKAAPIRLPQETVNRARSGDKEAFADIVRAMMKPIIAMITRMTQDPTISADLAQDTFLAAWQSIGRFRGDSKLESWLFSIASNKTRNYLASGNYRLTASNEEAISQTEGCSNPERDYHQSELRKNVFNFMGSLPTQQRIVFELRFYRQMKFDEIAMKTGSALGTVKTNYREAVKKLRTVASENGWVS